MPKPGLPILSDQCRIFASLFMISGDGGAVDDVSGEGEGRVRLVGVVVSLGGLRMQFGEMSRWEEVKEGERIEFGKLGRGVECTEQ